VFLLETVVLLLVVGVLNPFNTVVIISCLSGMCLSPMMALSQREMVNILGLREIEERTMIEVNRLEESNQNLVLQITKMKDTVDRLEDVEGALKQISELQGRSLTEYAEQIEEMKRNSTRIQNTVESKILTYIMDSAIKSDTDGDCGLNDEEAETMMQEITDIFGVKVHKDRFMGVVQENRNIGHIMTSFRRRTDDNDPDLKIFDYETEIV